MTNLMSKIQKKVPNIFFRDFRWFLDRPRRQNRLQKLAFSPKMRDFGAAGGPKTIENPGKNVRNQNFLNFGHQVSHGALVCARPRAMVSCVSSLVRKFTQTLHSKFQRVFTFPWHRQPTASRDPGISGNSRNVADLRRP